MALSGVGGATAFYLSSNLYHLAVEGGSSISDNSAGADGGALDIYATQRVASFHVSNHSVFASNRAAGRGGAVHILAEGDVGSILISDRSRFTNNTSGSARVEAPGGGAMNIRTAQTLSSFIVTGFSSLDSNRASAGDGGAVRIAGTGGAAGVVSIVGNSSVSGNFASSNGGGFYISVSKTVDNQPTSMFLSDGAIASRNRAGNVGGFLYAITAQVENIAVLLTVEGWSRVSENKAVGSGGGFYVLSSDVTLVVREASEMRANEVNCGGDAECNSDGGAAYLQSFGNMPAIEVVGGSVIAANRAGRNGGGIYAITDGVGGTVGRLLVDGSSCLTDNQAGGSGGALFIRAGHIADVRVDGRSYLQRNTAQRGDGGALYLQAQQGNVTSLMLVGSSQLTRNSAGGSGGGVFVQAAQTIAMASLGGASMCLSNHAGKTGGGFHFATTDRVLEGSLIIFTVDGASSASNNSATSGGFAYFSGYANISFTKNSTFANNRADLNGGLAALSQLPSALVFDSCVASNNSASRGYGGAFSVATVVPETTSGAGVCMRCTLRGTSVIGVTRSTLASNRARLDGGAFYIAPAETCCPSTVSLSFTGANMVANHADAAGGAVALVNPAGDNGVLTTVEFRNSTLKGNTAGSDAGTFTSSATHGGAIMLWYQPRGKVQALDTTRACLLRAEGTTFESNVCNGGNGGAVMLISCPAEFQRCTFQYNLASLSGGAIASLQLGRSAAVTGLAASSENVTTYNCTFLYNTAQLEFGGAIYLDVSSNGQALLDGCKLQGNKAAGQHGGGVLVASAGQCSAVAINNTRALDNVASLASAAAAYMLLADGAAGTVSNVELQANKAAITGGAVFFDVRSGGVLNVTNVTATGNTALAGDGGAMHIQVRANGSATLQNCSLTSNTAGGSGGALRMEARCGSQVNIQYSNMIRNVAGGLGGALYVSYGNDTLWKPSSGSGGSLTSAAGQAPLYPCEDVMAAAEVSSLVLAENHASGMGGALFLAPGSSVRMERLSMARNTASSAGGSVAAQNCSYAVLASSSINGSRAAGPGGGFFAQGCGRVLLRNVNVTYNQAAAAGGGLFIAGATSSLVAQDASQQVSTGHAAVLESGGFVYTAAILNRLNVSHNEATQEGTSSSAADCVGATALGSDYDNRWLRKTRGQGGGLFVHGSTVMAVSQTDLAGNNSAVFGSAFASTQHCNTTQAIPNGNVARCWALVLADSILPVIDATSTNATFVVNATLSDSLDDSGEIQVAQQALPIWMEDLVASSLLIKCSTPNLDALVHVTVATVSLELPPRAPVGYDAAMGGDLSWLTADHRRQVAYLDAGVGKNLTVPVTAGYAILRRMVARGWPGNYSLRFIFSGEDTLGVQVAPLEVPVKLHLCAVGETLDLTVADKESHASWTACKACPTNEYGLWNDSRPSLDSGTFNNGSYLNVLQLMGNLTERVIKEELAGCQACPQHAECPGGAVVVPKPGYWHSAPNSTLMHSCPNQLACGRDVRSFWQANTTAVYNSRRSAHLIACQQEWYKSDPPGSTVLLEWAKLNNITVSSEDEVIDDYFYPPMPPAPPIPPPPPPINYMDERTNVSEICLLWNDLWAGNMSLDDPNSYMQQQCAPGYTGNLCAACVEGFYIDSEFNCKLCPSIARTVGLGILSFFSNILLVLFTAITNFAEGFDDDKPAADEKGAASKGTIDEVPSVVKGVPAAPARKASNVELGDVVKVIVLHLQYLVIVTRLNVDYPNIIVRCQAVFSTVTGAENYIVYSPSCVLPNRDSAGQAEVQLLAGILTPCAVVIASMVVWAIRYAIRHPPKVSPLKVAKATVVSAWKVLPVAARVTLAAIRSVPAACFGPNGGDDKGQQPSAGGAAPSARGPFRLSAMLSSRRRSSTREACGIASAYGDIPVLTLGSLGHSGPMGHLPQVLELEGPLNPFAVSDSPLLATLSPLPTAGSGATVVDLGADDHTLIGVASADGATALTPASSHLVPQASLPESGAPHLDGAGSLPEDSLGFKLSGALSASADQVRERHAAATATCPVLDLDGDGEGGAAAEDLDADEDGGHYSEPLPRMFRPLSRRMGSPLTSESSFPAQRLVHSETWQRRAATQFASIRLTNLQGTLRRLGTMAVSRLEPHLNRPIEKVDQKLGLREQLGVVLMAAVFILYPSWAHAALSTFACYRIDDGSGDFPSAQRATWLYGYWVRDMQAKCYDGRHLSFYVPIGVASVCIFCLAPPLASFLFVWRMGQRLLKEDHVRKVYGFLYKRYKERFIWWETVLQLETLVLVAVEVLGRGLISSYQARDCVAPVKADSAPPAVRMRLHSALAIGIIAMNTALIFFYLSVVVRRFWPSKLVDEVAPAAHQLLRRLSTARRGDGADAGGRRCLCWGLPCWGRPAAQGQPGGRRSSKAQIMPDEPSTLPPQPPELATTATLPPGAPRPFAAGRQTNSSLDSTGGCPTPANPLAANRATANGGSRGGSAIATIASADGQAGGDALAGKWPLAPETPRDGPALADRRSAKLDTETSSAHVCVQLDREA
ncbi:hypothetical protein GPECTOR_15g323 [Gonium pectorale]|uniref:Right handed beta helix domain-containing protein n=1 Tax=Gonium pectorale TaxID=33097 RepID=A0A150GLB0_GONPE|nr:hypothetical protein GPECTOR_15g323 [Gonium pectorale]|eukprot:KXZ50639.1 hypothetical protein GPECTOR_15g323 [Gonium pectorale]